MSTIGSRIRQAREKAGLTLQQISALAQASGVPTLEKLNQGTLSRLENDVQESTLVALWPFLARVLKVSCRYLLEGIEDPATTREPKWREPFLASVRQTADPRDMAALRAYPFGDADEDTYDAWAAMYRRTRAGRIAADEADRAEAEAITEAVPPAAKPQVVRADHPPKRAKR